MPLSCSVFGCTKRHVRGGGVSFHGFPLRNGKLLSSWINAVNRKNFIPSKSSKVCSRHFRKEDFLLRPGAYIPGLKPDAVPSLLLGYTSSFLGEAVSTPTEELIDNNMENFYEIKSEMVEITPFTNSPLTVENKDIQTDVTGTEIEDAMCSLKLEIKALHQKLRRRNKQISDLVKLIQKGCVVEQEGENMQLDESQDISESSK